jgi:hypothetical protein
MLWGVFYCVTLFGLMPAPFDGPFSKMRDFAREGVHMGFCAKGVALSYLIREGMGEGQVGMILGKPAAWGCGSINMLVYGKYGVAVYFDPKAGAIALRTRWFPERSLLKEKSGRK